MPSASRGAKIGQGTLQPLYAPRDSEAARPQSQFDGDGHFLPQTPSPVTYSIANHSDEQIGRMDHSELIDLVRQADLPRVCNGTMERLKFLDRETLARLAYLTRRCCRNRIDSYCHCHCQSVPFVRDL
ncbi:MAG: hypothetical protein DWQ29_17835 [Planctomycetota bacterium]|nr:MAG: hypothetical protein DWQ29_17835 [Planctomycetota bacterium]